MKCYRAHCGKVNTVYSCNAVQSTRTAAVVVHCCMCVHMHVAHACFDCATQAWVCGTACTATIVHTAIDYFSCTHSTSVYSTLCRYTVTFIWQYRCINKVVTTVALTALYYVHSDCALWNTLANYRCINKIVLLSRSSTHSTVLRTLWLCTVTCIWKQYRCINKEVGASLITSCYAKTELVAASYSCYAIRATALLLYRHYY